MPDHFNRASRLTNMLSPLQVEVWGWSGLRSCSFSSDLAGSSHPPLPHVVSLLNCWTPIVSTQIPGCAFYWTMEDHIFHFNDRGTLQLQDDGICEALLEDFWTRILNSHEDLRLPKEQLSRVKRSCSSYNWLARYASVVIVRLLDSKYSTMTLVGLDGWKSHVHASVAAGRQTTALPDVSSPTIYELGPLSTDVIKELMQKFRQALLKSEENNTGNSRGQRPGHQGNQKTPSFARTVLWQIRCRVGSSRSTTHCSWGRSCYYCC